MVNETGLSVCTGTNAKNIPIWYKTKSCKPLLRPLSDMKEDEANVIADYASKWAYRKSFKVEFLEFAGTSAHIGIYYEQDGAPNSVGDGEYFETIIVSNDTIWARDKSARSDYKIILNGYEIFRFLLLKRFDIFNLIEDGLAIDSTTVKIKP